MGERINKSWYFQTTEIYNTKNERNMFDCIDVAESYK